MLVDDLRTVGDRALRAQVCVIGAGPAGLTVAGELAAAGVDVLVLEQGDGTWPSGPPEERSGFLDDLDFASRPWIPGTGWPLGPGELTPYRDRACAHAGLDAAENRRATAELDPSMLRAHTWQSGRGVRIAAGGPGGPRLYTHATVTHLDTDRTGAHVNSVEVTGAGGRRRRVEAARFVLAAGSIETPRLLLASRRAVAEGVGNRYDQVGRYLMARRAAVVGEVPAPGAALARLGARTRGTGRGRARLIPGMTLAPDVQRSERLLGAALWLQEAPQGGRTRALVGRALRAAAGRSRGRVELRCVVEHGPDRENRVTLTEDTDAAGLPLARVTCLPDPLQERTARRAAHVVAGEFRRLGLPAPVTAPWLDPAAPVPFTEVGHPAGTTRMSADPRTGVVDAQCRVHGVDNLYVAGSSVFPACGPGQPLLTALALAVRLAERLHADVAARPTRR
ncbi:GMC oxidoreductase [Nocardia thailandica]